MLVPLPHCSLSPSLFPCSLTSLARVRTRLERADTDIGPSCSYEYGFCSVWLCCGSAGLVAVSSFVDPGFDPGLALCFSNALCRCCRSLPSPSPRHIAQRSRIRLLVFPHTHSTAMTAESFKEKGNEVSKEGNRRAEGGAEAERRRGGAASDVRAGGGFSRHRHRPRHLSVVLLGPQFFKKGDYERVRGQRR